MNQEEIKHKLEQAKRDKDLALQKAHKEIERLAKLLSESEKPELRHGDYGIIASTRARWIVMLREKKLEWFGGMGGCGRSVDDFWKIAGIIKLGNLADDLSAMAEDVEEFRIGDKGSTLKVKIYSERYIEFDIDGYTATMHELKTAQEIHRKLGAMIATARRKLQKGAE